MSGAQPARAAGAARAHAASGLPGTWLLALVAGSHVLLYAFGYSLLWTMRPTALPLFFQYGSDIVAGHLPYRDFAAEYPPVAMAFFALPRLVTANFQRYADVLRGLLLACDLAIVAMLYAIAKRAGRAPAAALATYTIALLAIGPISSHQYDLLPAALTLGALWLFLEGHDAGAGAMLAAGMLAKVYPLLLAPLALLWYLRERAWGRMLRAGAGFAAAAIVALLPWLLVAPASLQRVTGYHGGRPVQVESSYGSALLADAAFLGHPVATVFSFGSENIAGLPSQTLAAVSPFVMLAALAAALLVAWRRLPAGPLSAEWLFTHALLVLLAGLLASKVLSPQYLIWILPLVPLAGRDGGSMRLMAGLFVVSGALTYYVFPTHYRELVDADTIAVSALLLRNLLLLAMAVVLACLAPQTHDHGRQLHSDHHQA